ncbi:hypothetical protein NAT47_01675 [Flavobacterium sp. HXWNR69]|uniref:Peptidase M56 domain-containing protein n=1 Tax=Flavobacterium fragile TaxID=2949085 RepID=A0ABT0TDS8_9FLAO|nr:hypothetical protein [Flavobacterium sp. HXWNR69]MCL9769117.1 hypothetical protein [Flavobacterium sp. HXWNR69]
MIVIVFKYLVPKGFRGLTLFPFVFLLNKKDKTNAVLLNHERIHIKQQLELLVVFFFVWYGLEFVFRLIQFRDKAKAYQNISFEREAYQFEQDLDYVNKRNLFSFFSFVI